MKRATIRILATAVLASASLACRPSPSDAEVEALVRRYDTLVPDAYRAGDFRIALPVVGPDEARRLTGHIGVRTDQGLTLDSHLDEIQFLGIERDGEGIVVRTRERWTYGDRRMGTGQPVGPDAHDRYEMRYHLRKLDGRWVVVETAFGAKPETSRPLQPMQGDARSMHGWSEPLTSPEGPSGPAAPATPAPGSGR